MKKIVITQFSKNKNKSVNKITSQENTTMAVATQKFRLFRRKNRQIHSQIEEMDPLKEERIVSNEEIQRHLSRQNNSKKYSTYYIEVLRRIT